jgi:hypothetical protein
MTARSIPNTNRQMLTASNGGAIERSYVYLPAPIWAQLQELARNSGASVSQIIESFAISGTAKLKDNNNGRTTRSST